MQWRDSDTEYGASSIMMHWAVALVVLFMLVTGLQILALPRGPDRSALLHWHVSVAVIALPIVLARTYWRLTRGKPALPPQRRAVKLAAGAAWRLLLAGTLLQYITGPAIVWAHGRPIEIFHAIRIPGPLDESAALAAAVVPIHQYVAFGLLGMIVLHVAGALFHLLVVRDGVTERMFGRARRSATFAETEPDLQIATEKIPR